MHFNVVSVLWVIQVLTCCLVLSDLEPSVFLGPFLELIRSEETSGRITGLALTSLNKFIAYGFIGESFKLHHNLSSYLYYYLWISIWLLFKPAKVYYPLNILTLNAASARIAHVYLFIGVSNSQTSVLRCVSKHDGEDRNQEILNELNRSVLKVGSIDVVSFLWCFLIEELILSVVPYFNLFQWGAVKACNLLKWLVPLFKIYYTMTDCTFQTVIWK